MKLLFLLFVATLVASSVYALTTRLFGISKSNRKYIWRSVIIAAIVFIILLGLIAFGIYSTAHQADTQCSSRHAPTSHPPTSLNSAMDYFAQGDYDYSIGNCQQAVIDYTNSIALNPNYLQAYNNRAYMNMRLRNYQAALPDLDKAIALNPNYIQALMNRGDIHNYYYQIDRQAAIADYNRVIALTGSSGGKTSVCGHLFLAKHNGWNFGAYVDYFRGVFTSCD